MESTLSKEKIKEILHSFGISEKEQVTWVYKNVWDIGDRYILKQSPDLDEFTKSLWLSVFLTERKIPVRQYIMMSDGNYLTYIDSIGYSLMTKIKGNHIDPYEKNSRETGVKLGWLIAQLHQALSEAEPPFELYNSDSMAELGGWITDEIMKNNITVSEEVLKACLSAAPLYENLPRQIIHRDMHLQNLVFEGEEFAGYLDFDISQRNVRIYDLCYIGSSMLVGNCADLDRFKIWQEIFNGVLCGYDSILHLNDDERAMIPILLIMIELTFVAWYSRQRQAELAQSCAEMANWCYEHLHEIKSAVSI